MNWTICLRVYFIHFFMLVSTSGNVCEDFIDCGKNAVCVNEPEASCKCQENYENADGECILKSSEPPSFSTEGKSLDTSPSENSLSPSTTTIVTLPNRPSATEISSKNTSSKVTVSTTISNEKMTTANQIERTFSKTASTDSISDEAANVCEDFMTCKENEDCVNGPDLFCKCKKNYENVTGVCTLKTTSNGPTSSSVTPAKIFTLSAPFTRSDNSTSHPAESTSTTTSNVPETKSDSFKTTVLIMTTTNPSTPSSPDVHPSSSSIESGTTFTKIPCGKKSSKNCKTSTFLTTLIVPSTNNKKTSVITSANLSSKTNEKPTHVTTEKSTYASMLPTSESSETASFAFTTENFTKSSAGMSQNTNDGKITDVIALSVGGSVLAFALMSAIVYVVIRQRRKMLDSQQRNYYFQDNVSEGNRSADC